MNGTNKDIDPASELREEDEEPSLPELDLESASAGTLAAGRAAIMRFAKLVGRENVIAAADCGFSSQALYRTEVHHTVVWEKFKAMRQGADLATRQLWGKL